MINVQQRALRALARGDDPRRITTQLARVLTNKLIHAPTAGLRQASAELPANVPVNVILLPMEGDPEAAIRFWDLAMRTRGSFLAPARDWP